MIWFGTVCHGQKSVAELMAVGGSGSSTLGLLAHIEENKEGTELHRKWGQAITLKTNFTYNNPDRPHFLKVIQTTNGCNHLGTKCSKPEPSEDISYSTHDSVHGQGASVDFLVSVFSSGGKMR